MHEGWEEGYRELFERLYNALNDLSIPNLTFELIQHRFTKPAKGYSRALSEYEA